MRARSGEIDPVTVAAIALVAYLVKNLVHEGLGHGGACVLVGGKPIAISSAWWDGSYEGLPRSATRVVQAAGTLANLLVGALLIPIVRAVRRSVQLRYALWLLMVTNLWAGAGYMLADPIGNFGDWSAFLKGLPMQAPLRAALVATGLLLSFATHRLAVATLGDFLGREPAARRARARLYCWLPYLVGGLAFTLAGLRNPQGPVFAFTSALATFGGTAFLARMPAVLGEPAATVPERPVEVERSWPWIVAGALALGFLALVLAPGLRFTSP